MDEKEKIEYQTVILAALLHDVGKFLHRGDGEYEGSHENASKLFIEKHSSKLANDNLYNIDLTLFLVQHHHSNKEDALEDEYFKKSFKGGEKRMRQLLEFVMRSDSYSCAERDIEEPHKKDVGSKRAPLDSIFSNINLDLKDAPENDIQRYHVKAIDTLKSFPDAINELPKDEYRDLIKEFEDNIPDLSLITKFPDVLNAWLNLLEKYTWAVPSDTRFVTSDVSLYDHLRSSAAIAACLYKRHKTSLDDGKNFDNKYELLLIGGTFSGIQNYIFDITNLGSGGAAKRLRARSFFVYIFLETIIQRVLYELDLPLVCNMFSAGGKFLLFAPNTNTVNEKLATLKKEIEKAIHGAYFNQFAFLMSWDEMHCYKSKNKDKHPASALKIYNFYKIADDMFHSLETAKSQKLQNVLIDNNSDSWNTEAFKATEIYSQYNEHGDCKICGKGPAMPELYDGIKYLSDNNEQSEQSEETNTCFLCFRDKFLIGQPLTKADYIAFARGKLTDDEKKKKIVIFNDCKDHEGNIINYYVDLLNEQKPHEDYYLIYDINQSNENKAKFNQIKPLNKHYANHVPVDDNKNCQSFEEMTKLSRWEKKVDKNESEPKQYFGSDLLGVMKADVDNLGLIFSKGFENPKKAEKGYDEVDRKTVSRFLTMGRMIDLFFSGWMKEVMTGNNKKLIIDELTGIDGIDKEGFADYLKMKEIDFSQIYTVFSGGDDMLLVGPWETMIIFSIFLNSQFRKFTSNNKYITLSAGLTFVKPKHPIASAIKQAESLLDISKEQGKDRITLFGTTIKWKGLPKLINFFLFLNKSVNDSNSNISTSFLHRLFEYHRMALKFVNEDKGKIEGLKYLSALSYDIGRNIVVWNKDGTIKNGEEDQKGLNPLFSDKPDENSLISNVKVPLFWALYRNRRIMKDSNSDTI
ncbi:MAG: type III-A CRISPR-associated protein Cas10/Csm1 [Candidatus Anammoxibacter sp.]